MYIITIDSEKCQGDGDCVEACPAAILSVVDGKAVVSGAVAECLGCEACVTTCPHGAIALQEI